MSVTIINCPETVLKEVNAAPVQLEDKVFVERKAALDKCIKEDGLDFAILYGDREHFANIEYFTKYDCRFEEGLFIESSDGKSWLVVGNEGGSYSDIVPFDKKTLYYGNFSLQGQPHNPPKTMSGIFREVGISEQSKVGLAGYKYHSDGMEEDLLPGFDVPYYIVKSLEKVCGESNISNFTSRLTSLPQGVRMTIRNANEIAFIEYQSVSAAIVMKRMIAGLEENISELEVSRRGGADLRPSCAFANVLSGEKSVYLGLKSPDDFSIVKAGGPMTLSYSTRGSMCARSGMAIYDESQLSAQQKERFEDLYKSYFQAIANWYSTIDIGVKGKELYKVVNKEIGGGRFNFSLNPGHSIGMDEWVNSPVWADSEIEIHDGTHIQCDMIASVGTPLMNSICEDTVVIAGEGLRNELKTEYPECYARIEANRAQMQEVLNIELAPSVLPMSSLNGIMFPYMLNKEKIFGQE